MSVVYLTLLLSSALLKLTFIYQWLTTSRVLEDTRHFRAAPKLLKHFKSCNLLGREKAMSGKIKL